MKSPPPTTVVSTRIETTTTTTTDTIETTVPVTTTDFDTTTEHVTTTQPTTTVRTVTKTAPPPAADTEPPWAGIARAPCANRTSRACRRSRATGGAPKRLSGWVHDERPSSGIRRVEVTLTRRVRRSCFAYIGSSFTAMPCRAAFGLWLRADLDGKRWSLVVGRLAPGRYVVRARAVDGAGNRQQQPARRVFILSTA